MSAHRLLPLALAGCLAGTSSFGCAKAEADNQAAPSPEPAAASAPASQPASQPAAPHAPANEFPVPPPPFSDGVFPCSDCHANLDVNSERRELEEHTDIKLEHGDRDRWCFDCHNPDNRDELRLASGRLVPFTESYRLCGQCHGDKLRDWKVGVHGKRTGSWSGKKEYLLCAHCHNPHSPRFKPLKPLPPPTRPADIRPSAGE